MPKPLFLNGILRDDVQHDIVTDIHGLVAVIAVTIASLSSNIMFSKRTVGRLARTHILVERALDSADAKLCVCGGILTNESLFFCVF